MATTFRSDATQAKPPPWCKKAIFPPAIALTNGNPSRLACFAYWLDLNAAPTIDVTESLILRYRQPTDDWYGASSSSGLRLVVHVTKELPTTLYTIVLEVWRDDAMLDDDSWHNVDAEVLPDFNTLELHHLHAPGRDANGLHVVA